MRDEVFDLSAFRSYDIRGIAGQQITPDLAFAIGKAFGHYVKQHRVDASIDTNITVGHDCRLTSVELHSAVIDGVINSGINVIDLGLCTTPMLTFACQNVSGIMVTASHNPMQYNGFKFVFNGGIFDGMDELIKLLGSVSQCAQTAKGKISYFDIKASYLQSIADNIRLQQKHKIIVDGANSPQGQMAVALFQKLGCEVGAINLDIDGKFSGHSPDTGIKENYQTLQREVLARNADFGFMFDGDGDRCAAVTAKGEIVMPDKMLALFSEDVLVNRINAIVVYDVKCSNQVKHSILQNGGVAKMSRTGRSKIFQQLKTSGAILAGEYSGHFFFNDNWLPIDDGLYAACRLIEGCEQRRMSLHKRVSLLPESFCSPEILVGIEEAHKTIILDAFAKSYPIDNLAQVSTIDGIRIDYANKWGLIRASNTLSALSLRFEAYSEESLEMIKQSFLGHLLTIAEQHNITVDLESNL